MKHGRDGDALRVLAQSHANGNASDELVQWEVEEIRAALACETSRSSYLDFMRTPGNRRRLVVVLSLCVGLNWMGNGVIS
jgi:hypothetical protein